MEFVELVLYTLHWVIFLHVGGEYYVVQFDLVQECESLRTPLMGLLPRLRKGGREGHACVSITKSDQ